jgi:hypothetical protein
MHHFHSIRFINNLQIGGNLDVSVLLVLPTKALAGEPQTS